MAKQARWKSVAAIAALLTISVVASCLLIGTMRERKVFVGNVVRGYRYRCTLSTDWRPTHNGVSGYVEEHSFAAAPSPIREWIDIHLFRQPKPTGNPVIQQPRLTLGQETGKGSGFIHVRSGYPELDVGGPLKMVTGKHFRVDNCPATLTGIDMSGAGINSHYTILLICTPDYTNTYFVTAAAPPAYSNQADREMQAIISSFHVEKVTVPMNEKQ